MEQGTGGHGSKHRRLGEAAIRLHLLTREQVETALSESDDADGEADGAPFVAAGLLTEKQLEYLRTVTRFKAERIADKRFGDLAIEHDWASPEQVRQAMEEQKRLFMHDREKRRLGELLVAAGVLTEEQSELLARSQEQARAELTSEAPAGFKISVSKDRLRALINFEPGDTRPGVAELRAALEEHGIVHGIDEAALDALADGSHPAGESLQVATGTPPTAPEQARIEYLFDTEPRKAGRQDEDGNIDFRDRGEIPQVDTDTVLARKHPPQPGQPGTDVYGKALPAEKARDPKLSAGKGAAVADDGLSLVAAVNGYPSLSPTGAVSVFPEYRIDGDLAYNTGHVEFNGRVLVSGTVHSGFRVDCGELVAKELEAAEIVAEGDVVIDGGVIGAHIRAGGSVTARYLHDARVEALGDIVVEREVLESHLTTSGAFLGSGCTVLTSRIEANKGVVAKGIGTDASKPCALTLGIDERVRQEIRYLERDQKAKRAEREALPKAVEAAQQRRSELDLTIGNLAQVQDRTLVELREAQDDPARCEELRTQSAQVEAELNDLFAQQDAANAEAEEKQARIEELDEAIAAIDERIEHLREWIESQQGVARVEVAGTLHKGTVIKTPHLDLRASTEHRRVALEERAQRNAKGETVWKLSPAT